MKFITEDELRIQYKKEPFTEYEIGAGTKITPGARQFLIDRGIKINQKNNLKKNKNNTKEESSFLEQNQSSLKDRKVETKMKSVEALFLVTAEELLSRDVLLSQQIIQLKKCFSDIKNVLVSKSIPESFSLKVCTGMNEQNYCDKLEECFEITEFHMQLEKGKEIIALNRLRSMICDFQIDVMEFFDHNEMEKKQCEEVIKKTNQIINALSQLICTAVGGKECQKKK